MTPESKNDCPPDPDWSTPRPELIPRSTYWPAGMAFGVTFLFWGIVSSPVVLGAGALMMVASLIGWIGEIRHEHE
jgi:hypothetical protein